MAGEAPPKHYTFVFSHALSEGQRNFWRDTLLPELRTDILHSKSSIIGMPWPGGSRGTPRSSTGSPTVLLQVTSGRPWRKPLLRAPTPSTNAVNVAYELRGVPEHAQQAGSGDPRFAYGVAGETPMPETWSYRTGEPGFQCRQGQRDALPSFSVAIREADRIQEVTARPREGVEVRAPEPWFADDAEGQRARSLARASLARGRPITLSGSHVASEVVTLPSASPRGLTLRNRLALGSSSSASPINAGTHHCPSAERCRPGARDRPHVSGPGGAGSRYGLCRHGCAPPLSLMSSLDPLSGCPGRRRRVG